MTLPALKQPVLLTNVGAPAPTPARLNSAPLATQPAPDPSRALMTRPAGAVFERHVRWGTEPDGSERRRIPSGTRPAGLFFSTLDWSGNGAGPTEHQQAQTVDSVFAAFNWT